MQWKSIAISLVPAFLGAACSHGETHAAPPKTASKLPAESHPIPPGAEPATPPAPDATAATRKPAAPKVDAPAPPETPPADSVGGAAPGSGAPTGSEFADEPLLNDEDAAIPTQEEADREAELAITDDNADQEYEKLEKELAEGSGGG
jgi:hypothetical protein